MYRLVGETLEVLLVHPGGPFWAKKDFGCWSIPKGEYADHEDPLDAAKREFLEETGFLAESLFQELSEIKQKGGKWVKAWAFAGDWDPAQLNSNTFEMEYPPKSGTIQTFPEVDRAAWFNLEDAKNRILPGQIPLLDELAQILGRNI